RMHYQLLAETECSPQLRGRPLPQDHLGNDSAESDARGGRVDYGRLAAMAYAHRAMPLVPGNSATAEGVLWPACIVGRRVQRVALIAHDFAPKLGGMETVARSLADGLTARGIEVGVYTASRLGAASDRVRTLYRPLPRPARIDLWADLLATIDAALRDAP